MAIPLVLLGAARLVLGDFLARRVDPMQELLFGDEIMMLWVPLHLFIQGMRVVPFVLRCMGRSMSWACGFRMVIAVRWPCSNGDGLQKEMQDDLLCLAFARET